MEATYEPISYCCAATTTPTRLSTGAVFNLPGCCGEKDNLLILHLDFSDGSDVEYAYCEEHRAEALRRIQREYVTGYDMGPPDPSMTAKLVEWRRLRKMRSQAWVSGVVSHEYDHAVSLDGKTKR